MRIKDIARVKWDDVSENFQNALPANIYAAFERVFKKHSSRFFVAKYPFGTFPLENGVLKVPYQGMLLRSNAAELPEEIRTELHYGHVTVPLCILLKGTSESYIHLPHHLIPLDILKPGNFFGLNSCFYRDRNSHIMERAYSYSSGSRSLLMLSRISHEQYNERIAKNYTIDRSTLCPKTFNGQWELFRALSSAPEFKADWETEFVIFPRSTFEIMSEDESLHHLLINRMLENNFFAQNQMMYDLVWSIFFEKLSNSIKNAPSILETVKHVIKLAMSEAPGYVPVTTEDQGPMKELTDIFLNVYRIRYYLPIFMEIGFFNRKDPIYYSLQKHTFFCNIPEKVAASRTIDELIAIKRLIYSFKQHVLDNKFPFSLENTVLFKTLQEVEFDFFHPHGGEELNTDIEGMVADDPRFMSLLRGVAYDESLKPTMASLFFNGCIRISPLKKTNKPRMKDVLGLASFANFRLDDRD